MKTIFITIFEGVEAKNILRTSVVPTLLKNSDIRIVFFTRGQRKVDYYRREFNDPRIIYEAVEPPRVVGWDNLFRFLKFQLLRTETTNLRRKMVLEVKRNYVSYWLGSFFNLLLARPAVLKIVRILDFALGENDTYRMYFERYNPDLVFLANLFDEPEVHLLREAKKRGIKAIGFVNSWDKATARCILRLLPDKIVVFNNMVRDEIARHHGVNPSDIFVSGVPQYDRYFQGSFSSREEFFKKIKVSPSKKLLVYAPMGTTYSSSDWDMIDLLEHLRREGRFGKDIQILVRFPPNDFIDERELQKRPWLLYDQPGTLFSQKRGIDWDLDFEDLKYLSDTLFHMSLIVCYASSISVDAAILDKPVININFEIRPKELMSKSPTQFYRMEHYKKALKTGGIRLVENEEKLVEWVKRYQEDPSLDREARKKLVEDQCKFLDGKSGERIGNFVLDHLSD